MTTRTGDATAELVDLLRLHCPDVAEETLQRLASAAVALGEASGEPAAAGDAAQGLRWNRLTLGGVPGLAQVVPAAQVPVQVISALLEFVAGILEVVSKLLVGLTDPFRALILAAIDLLTTIVEDLLNSGAYVYVDAPGLTSNVATMQDLGLGEVELPTWIAGQTPPKPDRPADGFAQWAYRFRQSFDDPGDRNRPTFSDGAPVEALFIVATAPQLPDLAAMGPLLASLFDAKAFGKAWEHFATTFPEWPADPDRTRIRSTSVRPDWNDWRLRDLSSQDNYPLRMLEKVPRWLEALLLNVDNVIELIKSLVAAVRDKIEVLRQIIAILQGVIDALAALLATGLHGLFVHTDEGIDGLVRAFLEAENRPNTSTEDGSVQTANAVMGVCLLAGTSEIAPIWMLFGQGEPADQAYASLVEDWNTLGEQAEASVADAKALASKAWKGAEGAGGAEALGITGLSDELVTKLGTARDDLEEAADTFPGAVAEGFEQLLAEGVPLDPATLAFVESTRRARRRGSRSLAMSLGPRQGGNRGGAS
ncbi:hypothetical protein SAMN05444365_10631 [Micromonospora pattaloongensis]|uniref:Uncharacterized protein n=1 Tax=Micromonospora pattaloongensis TaxID=405436 RepID=A0A1H3QNV7_9ACTN|nr:hypothetical protein [Micromonospora pattaloongensis]SDZ14973.1 hypothetical protein SAMN05444365_10631 [Micromonospora pattaloongensis]